MVSNVESPIVAKFGGSSMADADSVGRVADIVRSDPDRRFVIVSAPGRNGLYKEKITDLLIAASGATTRYQRNKAFTEFSQRFLAMGKELGSTNVGDSIDQVHEGIDKKRGLEWCASRGEWLMARILAGKLRATFVDAEDLIRIQNGGQIDPDSYNLVRQKIVLEPNCVVIPGFYGLDKEGEIKTFARGGSDITGAIIARGVNARVYENWTDVDGVMSANPKVVEEAEVLRRISYEEMRELGVRGAEVLQRDTILPLIEVGIPINLRNTFNPADVGTMIEADREIADDEHVIGVTGEGPFVSFNIQKYGMNDEMGIGESILEMFTQAGVSYEHSPSGKDYMSVIVNQDQLDGAEQVVLGYIKNEVNPDRIWIQRNLGLLSLIGQGIQDHAGWVSRNLFKALDEVGLFVKAYNFGTSGISIVVALDNDKLDEAIKVAHKVFINPKLPT